MVKDSPWELTLGADELYVPDKTDLGREQPGHPQLLGLELGLPMPGVPSTPRMGGSRNVYL